jgi:multidrug efflux pump subunit AcrA (membrane-fusion protein)
MRDMLNRVIGLLKRNRKVSIGAGIVLLILLLILIFSRRSSDSATTFQTEKVVRENLVATIGATGTVRAKQSATLNWMWVR